jgi:hypothetical protein
MFPFRKTGVMCRIRRSPFELRVEDPNGTTKEIDNDCHDRL